MGCWWSIRDVYEKPGYKHPDSHIFHSKLEASLCAMALSFGSCAPLCNPVTAWAVIPYGWPPASSSMLTLMSPLRGAPRGRQEEDQRNWERRGPLCLSQSGEGPAGGRRQGGEDLNAPPIGRGSQYMCTNTKIPTAPYKSRVWVKFYEFHSAVFGNMVMLMKSCFKLAEHILKRNFFAEIIYYRFCGATAQQYKSMFIIQHLMSTRNCCVYSPFVQKQWANALWRLGEVKGSPGPDHPQDRWGQLSLRKCLRKLSRTDPL